MLVGEGSNILDGGCVKCWWERVCFVGGTVWDMLVWMVCVMSLECHMLVGKGEACKCGGV